METGSNNDNLSAKALEDRRLILEALAQRFKWKRLSERKTPDGELCYQEFFNRMEKKQEIPVRLIKKQIP